MSVSATIPLRSEPQPRKPPLFPVESFYAEQAREALELFDLASQLPIPGLAGHKPNLPGYPYEDTTISYLRSTMMRYMIANDDRYTDLFDWDHGKFPTHEEQFALIWADGLIDHLMERWGWKHLLSMHEAMFGDFRDGLAMRTWALHEAFVATRPTLTLDEHEAIKHITPTLRALLERIAPGGPREAMFSAPQIAYLQTFREPDDEDESDAA